MKKLLILVIILITLSLSGCGGQTDESDLIGVPYAYSLDNVTLDISQIDLMIPFFSFTRIPSPDAHLIKNAYIQGEDGQKLNVTIEKIERSEAPVMQINNRDVYGGSIHLNIEFKSESMINAELVIEYEDEKFDRLEVGSLSVADIENEHDPEVIDHIRYAYIHAAANDIGEAGLTVNAIVIEIDAIDEVRIKAVDFGVPGLGIDQSGLKVFHGMDTDLTLNHVHDMTLNKKITDVYDRRNESQPDITCDLLLQAGKNIIICPLTYLNENQPNVKKIFTRLVLDVENKKYTYAISSFPLYSQFRYHPEQIEKILIQAGKKIA